MIVIYGLFCPVAGIIRYVGKTVNPAARLRAHISGARTFAYSHHTARWIRRLLSAGFEPQLHILRVLEDGSQWQDVERSYISAAPELGWDLTNSTVGGEGLDYRDEEEKRRYRKKLSEIMKAVCSTQEWKLSQGKRSRAAWSIPESRQRRIAITAKACGSDEFKKRMSVIGAEVGARPEVRLKKSSASSASWQNPDIRERRASGVALAKPRMSASAKAWRDDPVKMGNWRASIEAPESIAKRKASARARSTPEYRAMMAERTRLSWDKRRAKKADQDLQNEVVS